MLNQGKDGTPVAEICRKAKIRQAADVERKKGYGGLLPDAMRRPKALAD